MHDLAIKAIREYIAMDNYSMAKRDIEKYLGDNIINPQEGSTLLEEVYQRSQTYSTRLKNKIIQEIINNAKLAKIIDSLYDVYKSGKLTESDFNECVTAAKNRYAAIGDIQFNDDSTTPVVEPPTDNTNQDPEPTTTDPTDDPNHVEDPDITDDPDNGASYDVDGDEAGDGDI